MHAGSTDAPAFAGLWGVPQGSVVRWLEALVPTEHHDDLAAVAEAMKLLIAQHGVVCRRIAMDRPNDHLDGRSLLEALRTARAGAFRDAPVASLQPPSTTTPLRTSAVPSKVDRGSGSR